MSLELRGRHGTAVCRCGLVLRDAEVGGSSMAEMDETPPAGCDQKRQERQWKSFRLPSPVRQVFCARSAARSAADFRTFGTICHGRQLQRLHPSSKRIRKDVPCPDALIPSGKVPHGHPWTRSRFIPRSATNEGESCSQISELSGVSSWGESADSQSVLTHINLLGSSLGRLGGGEDDG